MKKNSNFPAFLLLALISCKKNPADTPGPDPVLPVTPVAPILPATLLTELSEVASGASSAIMMDKPVSMIHAAEAGSTSYISIYGFDYPALPAAVVKAAERGLYIKVMIDLSREERIEQTYPTLMN